MAPQRARTTIDFVQRPSAGGLQGGQPRLTLFEHVAGAKVLADLFPYYRLPNGRKAYYYYDAGELQSVFLHNHVACLVIVCSAWLQVIHYHLRSALIKVCKSVYALPSGLDRVDRMAVSPDFILL